MHELKTALKIEDMIYEIRGKYVILDREVFATKCHKKLK